MENILSNRNDINGSNGAVKKFVLFSAILFTAIFIIENINHRFWLNDFRVFYMAAEAMFGGKQVYGIPFGLDTGFYKYSPFTLLFFAPFTVLPFNTAAVIYFYIDAACIIATLILLFRILIRHIFIDRKISFLILFLTLLCVLNHLVRELHLGNTNMILVLLLSLSLKDALESKHLRAGLLLAIVILTKPYFLICALPLLLVKDFKTIASLLVSLIIFVLVTLFITGFSRGVSLYAEWFSAMKEHSGYLASQHTLFSLLQNYLGITIPPSYGIVLFGLTGVLLFIFFLSMNRTVLDSTGSAANDRTRIVYYFLLIALVPTLLITDTEHFLFSLPLITILILQLSKSKDYLRIGLFILLMFLYGGNSSDLLGKKLAHNFEEWGLLGLSNMIIIGSVIILYAGNKFKAVSDNL